MDNLHQSALEVVIAVGVVLTVVAAAIGYYQTASMRAQLSEATILTSAARADVVVYRAEYGRWPVSSDETWNGHLSDRGHLGRHTKHLDLGAGGAITAIIQFKDIGGALAGGQLTYRPATVTADSGSPIVWVCGNAKAPPGMTVSGDNRTTISEQYLQFTCRGGKGDGESKAD